MKNWSHYSAVQNFWLSNKFCLQSFTGSCSNSRVQTCWDPVGVPRGSTRGSTPWEYVFCLKVGFLLFHSTGSHLAIQQFVILENHYALLPTTYMTNDFFVTPSKRLRPEWKNQVGDIERLILVFVWKWLITAFVFLVLLSWANLFPILAVSLDELGTTNFLLATDAVICLCQHIIVIGSTPTISLKSTCSPTWVNHCCGTIISWPIHNPQR